MPNKMLIDATHPEETRVVVVRGNRVEEFDFESAQRKQLRGNIYLAKVTRVEPSLQAAFIEYGGNRHGFLAFSEIHPDYYQIPVADRQALIEADERAHREAEEESENRSNRRRSRHRGARRRGHGDRVRSDIVEGAPVDPANSPQPFSYEFGNEQTEAQGHETEAHEAFAHDHTEDNQHHGLTETHAAGPDEAPSSSAAEPFDSRAVTSETLPTSPWASHDDVHHTDIEGTSVHGEIEPGSEIGHDDEHDDHGAHHGGDHAVGELFADHAHDDDEDDDEPSEEEIVESVGGDDALEEVPERSFRPRRQYKIQEVIKRRQVMLVQVVKEERGNKGAALTTYLSLAGRYAVLMPNTARGGGISRKITSAQDRSRLKEVVQDLDVPEGMGIILRTAGAARTKPEIKRDFEYLIRMWETVRDLTLKSQAPTLVYEEGSLIKRSLRDLYNKEIEEIQVAGESGYREARDFMKMLMPTHTRAVKQYHDGQPLFSRMGVESQLDAMFSPTVQLRSGGYIVINQTEALVSIDVNSGRSTREHHIEDTALKTNLEAAEEVARQLRLRDLAGLIVIDFIDMDEKRNNRAVERKMSECLRHDRARIQVGRISHFGLLEMSRQRIRASVLESSTEPCPHCGGTGHVRSVASVALQLLRGLEEALMKGATHNMMVRTRTEVALYVLNHKRGHLRDLENAFKVTLAVVADATVAGQQSFIIERGEQVHTLEAAKALLAAQAAAIPATIDEPFEDDDELFAGETDDETNESEELADSSSNEDSQSDGEGGPRRRRRRRRRGRGGEGRDSAPSDGETVSTATADGESLDLSDSAEGESSGSDVEENEGGERAEQTGERRPRRRGRRGGRHRRNAREEGFSPSGGDDSSTSPMPTTHEATAHEADVYVSAPEPSSGYQQQTTQDVHQSAANNTEERSLAHDSEKPRRRSTIREKVSFFSEPEVEQESPARSQVASAPVASSEASESTEQPQKAGWWSRRFGGGK
jgi:ribonuclease E